MTDATKGLRIIYHSKGARLVPLKEMVSAIYVNRQAKSQLGVSATISDIHSGCPSIESTHCETRLYCTCSVHYTPRAILCFCSSLSSYAQKILSGDENKNLGLANMCQLRATQICCLQRGSFSRSQRQWLNFNFVNFSAHHCTTWPDPPPSPSPPPAPPPYTSCQPCIQAVTQDCAHLTIGENVLKCQSHTYQSMYLSTNISF